MSHGSRGTKHLPITQPHLNCCHNRHIPMGWVTLLNKHWRSRVTPCTDWLWLHLLSFLCLPGFLVSLTGVLTVTWRVPLLPCLYCLVQAFSLFFYFFYIFPKTGLKLYIVMNDLELLIFLLLPFQCWDYGYWWPCPMQGWDLNRRWYAYEASILPTYLSLAQSASYWWFSLLISLLTAAALLPLFSSSTPHPQSYTPPSVLCRGTDSSVSYSMPGPGLLPLSSWPQLEVFSFCSLGVKHRSNRPSILVCKQGTIQERKLESLWH